MQLCIKAGYDNAIVFLEFGEDDIKLIEQYAQEKESELIEKSAIYCNIKPFAFLPGHRKVLTLLSSKIKSFKSKKKCKKNLFHVAKAEASKAIVEETIELLSNDELNDIKRKLLEKLNIFARSIGLSPDFSDSSISTDIEPYIPTSLKKKKTASYRCIVKCSCCNKRIPCTHNSYWQSGNLENHLRTHTNLNPTSQANSNIENVVGNTTAINSRDLNSGINENLDKNNQIATDVNSKELNELLGYT